MDVSSKIQANSAEIPSDIAEITFANIGGDGFKSCLIQPRRAISFNLLDQFFLSLGDNDFDAIKEDHARELARDARRRSPIQIFGLPPKRRQSESGGEQRKNEHRTPGGRTVVGRSGCQQPDIPEQEQHANHEACLIV